MNNPRIKTMKPVFPLIYAYSTPGIEYHDGWLKIGMTERSGEKRIYEQTRTAGIATCMKWSVPAIYDDNMEPFTDEDFHKYLERKGIERKSIGKEKTEWFKIEAQEARRLINEFRANHGIIKKIGAISYKLREEQERAVAATVRYFRNENDKKEFLWNAKPRFGKTLCAYDLCKRLMAKKVLVVTNRPAIANSWYDDYVKFFGPESGYYFISSVDALKNKSYVYTRENFTQEMVRRGEDADCIEFVSLQDLKGSVYFGGIFDKLREVAELDWDILIVDEAHEGVDTYKTDVAFDQIKRKYTLHLSGTPFKALANEKFEENAIFNWTYADEQRAKRNWEPKESPDEKNPYGDLPQLNLFVYRMSDIVLERVKQGADFDNDGKNEEYAFDLNEFFMTNASGNFIHETAVDKFLDALSTQEKFPFSTDQLRDELRHTLWLLKYVRSAKALAKKLEEHPVFKDYKIVLAAGDGSLDDEGETKNEKDIEENIKKSYDKVKNAINSYEKTITLSVGQLTTGITIPEWTAVMMLSNVKSPALYMQAAFRAQNPLLTGESGKMLRKENAYVFDFDPARTLELVEKFANDLSEDTANGKGDSELRQQHVHEFLNFFPVYGEDDEGEMIALDAEEVLSVPRIFRSKEVVRRGFMSNYLFQNIGNIFNAPAEVIEIISKFDKVEEPVITQKEQDEIRLDEDGNVIVPEETVIGITQDLFGDKIYEEIEQDLTKAVETEMESTRQKGKEEDEIELLLKKFRTDVTDKLVQIAKDNYGRELTASVRKNVTRKINAGAEKEVRKLKGNYDIDTKRLEIERQDRIGSAHSGSEVTEINAGYEEKQKEIKEEFYRNIEKKKSELIENAAKEVAKGIETSKKNKEKEMIEDGVRAHLRGFARTIPSFLMAYGDEKTTLEQFDKIIPDEVFIEVTGITLAEFRKLRDGFDYSDKDGNPGHYDGFFDVIVFNDSVKEFLTLKKRLANYFEENQHEDIFDYIPPQRTNQIFTPKKVVKKMTDDMERENPGCFDDPNNTFIDLYMKSGLYITEIVRRLFNSPVIKKLYPNEEERLNHIFAHQVYGLAPTEIIYRIAKSYILGFDDEIHIEKDGFRLCDSLPYAKEGTLDKKLDELFGEDK